MKGGRFISSNEATAWHHPEVHFTKTNGACQPQRPVEERDERVPRCRQNSGTEPLSTFRIRNGVVSLDYNALHPSGPKHHQSCLSHTWGLWQTYWHNKSDLSRKKGSLRFFFKRKYIISCQGSIYETIFIWYLIIRRPGVFSICFIHELDLVGWNLRMRLSCILLKPARSPVRWNIEAGIEERVQRKWSTTIDRPKC